VIGLGEVSMVVAAAAAEPQPTLFLSANSKG
jgi:hypothetical protein